MDDGKDLGDEVKRLIELREQDQRQIAKLSHEVRQLRGVGRKVEGLIDVTGGLKDEVIGIRRKDEERDAVTQAMMDAASPRPVQQQGGIPGPRSADS